MKHIVAILLVLAASLSSCEAKPKAVISVQYKGNTVKVKPAKLDSVDIQVNGTDVKIKSQKKGRLNICVKGKSEDGRLEVSRKSATTLLLDGLYLNSNEGAPFIIKGKKPTEIVTQKRTPNRLSITACQDTANNKGAVIWSKGDLRISGEGHLDLLATGDGCRGIVVKGDLDINDLELYVVTSGDNLGKNNSMPNFGMGGPMPDFGEGGFPGPPPGFGEGGFPGFPGGGDFPGPPPGFEEGGFPGPPPGVGEGGFPNFDEGGFPGFGGGFGGASGDPDDTIKVEGFKQKYLKTTKAIKCEGMITINSGIVYCKTTSAGAEGIEGKQGVTINGGTVTVDAVDDAINANGVITFNGGVVKAESHCNDAVDANVMGGFTPMKEGQGVPSGNANGEKIAAIEMNGGEVYALSHVGAPEEGLDCDFAPLSVTGGMLFSVGAGMGEMPSTPTLNTAKQPTLLLLNLNLKKDEKIQVYDGEECVFVYDTPFSFNGSASILSFPLLKVGRTYKIVTLGYEREVTMNEAFVIVR